MNIIVSQLFVTGRKLSVQMSAEGLTRLIKCAWKQHRRGCVHRLVLLGDPNKDTNLSTSMFNKINRRTCFYRSKGETMFCRMTVMSTKLRARLKKKQIT